MRFRTLWISDLHLGSRSCQAEALLTFLNAVRCDRLYLVGDIVDLIAMRRAAHWPATHSQVLRALLELSRSGVEVTYVPGNHDADFRALVGSSFENVRICRQLIHTTAAGKRLLVSHGDELDALALRRYPGSWLAGFALLVAGHRSERPRRDRSGLHTPL